MHLNSRPSQEAKQDGLSSALSVVTLHGISRTLVEVLNKWQCKVLVIKHLGEIKNETKTSLSKACISLGQEQLISKKILQDLSPLEGD